MRCLSAWRLCSVRGQESNAVFECLVTMPDRGAGKQCAVCVPGDHALSGDRKAMRCLGAWDHA